MKKIISTLFSLVFAIVLFAQQAPPQGINYQAMVYVPYGNQQVGVNSAGQIPANTKEVVVKFTLEEGNNGPVIYEETHTDTTDQYGLLNTVIGTGTPTSNSPGLFNQIDWSLGDPHLRVSITLTQYNSTVSSYQKLWSVPYALYADHANSSNTANHSNSSDYATSSGYADTSGYSFQAGNGLTGIIDNGDGTLTLQYLDGSSNTTGVLTGLTGPQGPQGQSAYDLWLANGNSGTLQDFLSSLQGATGPQGSTGPQGPQGPAGNGFQNGTTLGQVMYWDGSQWILLNPGAQSQILTMCNGVPTWTPGGVCPGTGTITALNCGGATHSGNLYSGVAASGVSSNISYTGGNGGTQNGQSVASTGVTGLTATLAPGNFVTGSGTLTYTITGTPNTTGTASFAISIGGQSCTFTRTVTLPPGTITALSCGTATNTGTLTAYSVASGVSSSVPYTGGNGGTHNGQTVTSTGVTGLTANLVAGTFAVGAGSLTYTISGTPNASGTASFALNIGGQICTLTRTVVLPTGTISTLSCGTATNTGTLTAYSAASGVSSSVPYTGGNGGTHNGQTVTSTGVTGLTATLAAGTFAVGAGNLTYTITGTPASGGTASFALNIGGKTCTLTRTVGLPVGTITALSCGTATNTGTLTSGSVASGVSSSVPYTGGNGGSHNGQTVASTGVTGLTATLAAGTFAVGAGNLTYTISGTPSAGGTASFALNIGGKTCTLTRTVNYAYPAGTINCTGSPTSVTTVTNPTTGKQWMDRNLGATQVATSSTTTAAYGDLYQWGRRADGHQCRTSTTTTTLSSIDQPANGNFILTTTSPFDWRSPQNTNLWQGLNGVNNPCPIGFRLPTSAEWLAEQNTWSSSNSSGAFASVLKLTMGGYRHEGNGNINSLATFGYYWSSNIAGTSSWALYFTTTTSGPSNNVRGNGVSVRCIKN